VGVLLRKDFAEIFKNRMSLIITVMIIIILPIYFHFMPSDVEETLVIGIHAPGLEGVFGQINASDEALDVLVYNDTNPLKLDVEDGDITAGIVLPADFVQTLIQGKKPRVDLYFPSVVPEEAREPVKAVLEELSFRITGQVLPVSLNTEIIGEDYAGRQLPFRDQARPLWVSLVLLVEIMSLAYLIIEEKQTGAIYALLVTPVTTWHIFSAKIIVGTTLASVETLLVIALMGSFGSSIAGILINVLLGAIMATGFAFLVATPARDLKSSFSWLMIPYIVLLVPPMTVIYPQAASWVLKLLPSYYLADTFNKILNQGIGLSGVWQNLAILAAFDAVILIAGMVVLRRKFR
jgi:ABC-2 type transport system permease protein